MKKDDNMYFYDDYDRTFIQRNNGSHYADNRLSDTNYRKNRNVGYIKNYKAREYTDDDMSEDIGYGNEDYAISEEAVTQKKSASKQALIVMQIISCALVIVGILAIKNFLPEYYNMFCQWYNTEINKSIVAGTDLNGYNIVSSIPDINSQTISDPTPPQSANQEENTQNTSSVATSSVEGIST